MKYDFDTIYDRRNTCRLKWNVTENEFPMWVADMDFKTAPEILCELEKSVEHGIFGYTVPDNGWYDSYISWWSRRHGLKWKRTH